MTESVTLSVEQIKNGPTINVFVKLDLPLIMVSALFAHLDLNLAMTKLNASVLEIKNGYLLILHVFNAKQMLPHQQINQSANVNQVILNTIKMEYVIKIVT